VIAVYVADEPRRLLAAWPAAGTAPPIPGLIFTSERRCACQGQGSPRRGAASVVIAENRYIAEDALDDIVVELEHLPAVVDLEGGLDAGSVKVHDDLDSICSARSPDQGDYARARRQGRSHYQGRFRYEHGISITDRDPWRRCAWDARGNQMTIWDTTHSTCFRAQLALQACWAERAAGPRYRPLSAAGFGPKIMMF